MTERSSASNKLDKMLNVISLSILMNAAIPKQSRYIALVYSGQCLIKESVSEYSRGKKIYNLTCYPKQA